MNKINEFDLLSPSPLNFYSLKIYKPTLRDISLMGADNFNRINSIFLTEIEDIKEGYKKIGLDSSVLNDMSMYQFHLSQCQDKNSLYFLEVKIAFFTYIKREIILLNNNLVVKATKTEEEFIFNEKLFNEFSLYIKLINQTEDVEEEDEELITDNLEMKAKFEEARRKVKEAKKREKRRDAKNKEGISLSTAVSALCTFDSGYNMLNIWDLTITQFKNQLNIHLNKEDYDNKIILLSSGGIDGKKIGLKYWIT